MEKKYSGQADLAGILAGEVCKLHFNFWLFYYYRENLGARFLKLAVFSWHSSVGS